MIRRLLWLVLGAVLGIWLMRKLGAIARSYSPTGLAGRAHSRWGRFRDGMLAFGREVKTLADAREIELRAALAAQEPTPLPETRRGPAPRPGSPAGVDERPLDRHGD